MIKIQADAVKFLKVGHIKVFDTEMRYSRVIKIQASTRHDIRFPLTMQLHPKKKYNDSTRQQTTSNLTDSGRSGTT